MFGFLTSDVGEVINEKINEAEGLGEKLGNYFSGLPVRIVEGFFSVLPKLLFAILIYIVGALISKLVMRIMSKGAERGNIDRTAHSFLKSLVSIILKTLILVIVLSVLGIPMTSIIAVIGAAGLAVGLALQNSLSNIAGGFIILFSKPFKVGDYIETNDIGGVVESISILYTKLKTPDMRDVFIPNGAVSSSKLTNCMNGEYRRLSLEFSVSYDADTDKAIKLISEIVEANEMAAKNPKPLIRVVGYAASSVNISTYVWTKPCNFGDLKLDLLDAVRKAFDSNGIDIPFDQLDIHMK